MISLKLIFHPKRFKNYLSFLLMFFSISNLLVSKVDANQDLIRSRQEENKLMEPYNQNAIEQGDLYIFNNMGQLILSQTNLKENTKINVSFLPKGLYNAHLLLQDDQIIQNIIIN